MRLILLQSLSRKISSLFALTKVCLWISPPNNLMSGFSIVSSIDDLLESLLSSTDKTVDTKLLQVRSLFLFSPFIVALVGTQSSTIKKSCHPSSARDLFLHSREALPAQSKILVTTWTHFTVRLKLVAITEILTALMFGQSRRLERQPTSSPMMFLEEFDHYVTRGEP